jgi:hypothetical protein
MPIPIRRAGPAGRARIVVLGTSMSTRDLGQASDDQTRA